MTSTSSPRRRSDAAAPAPRRWALLGWLLVTSIVGLLALRWIGPNHTMLLALVAMVGTTVVPLGLATVAAWRARSRWLQVAVATTWLALLAVTHPWRLVVGCGPDPAGPDDIVIHTANVLAERGNARQVARSITAGGADVVVMQEVRWDFLRVLRSDPELRYLAFRSEDTAAFDSGTVIWSRWPLTDITTIAFEDRDLLSATVRAPQGAFVQYSIHTRAPIPSAFVTTWTDQLHRLAAVDQAIPTVLAGDFNATQHHRPFQAIIDQGWVDAHQAKGCGFNPTWPVDPRVPFPFLQLDHVLVSDHFTVRSVMLGDPGGSDHRPVIVRLARSSSR